MHESHAFSSRPLRLAAGLALSGHLLVAAWGPPFLSSPVRLAHDLERPAPQVVNVNEILDLEPLPRSVPSPDAALDPFDLALSSSFDPTDEPEIDLPPPPDMDDISRSGSGGQWAGIVLRRGVAPTVLKRVEPIYPEMARRAGTQGEVELEVLVNEQGRAREVRVAASTGSSLLERAASDAIRRWVFAPAKQGNEAVAAWVRIRFVFDM